MSENKTSENERLLLEIIEKDAKIKELESKLSALNEQYLLLENDLLIMRDAFFWKITGPARRMLDAIKRFLKKYPRVYAKMSAIKFALRKAFVNISKEWHRRSKSWNNWHFPKKVRKEQCCTNFPEKHVFSILVPLYNTPPGFLRAMLKSVQEQTYSDWELCLADGSDSKHNNVGIICSKAAKKDSRIRYCRLERNLGISGNTNACIDMATGDWIVLFDHDDILHPAALFEVMRAVCEKGADFVYTDECTFRHRPNHAYNPNFKPDYAPDSLRGNNYICHLTAFSRGLLQKAGGGFNSECDGSQDYDIILRLTEQAQNIVHIPKILYYWRAHANSVASDISTKLYAIEAAHKAIADHLQRVGLNGQVSDTDILSIYHIRYRIQGKPLVSIIIPNCDHAEDLKRCICSIQKKTTWPQWEIIVVENNSRDEKTFDLYRELEKDKRIRVVTWSGAFNYSAICNYGAQFANGEQLLQLNNDTYVITPGWLEEMLMFAQRSDVGAVGAKLYYIDDTVQHAGVYLGVLGVAAHCFRGADRRYAGYMGRLSYAQNVSAVTGACMMVPKAVWDEIGGLDESFPVAYNDIDQCIRIRKTGRLIVFTPFAELYHEESKSRGSDTTPERFTKYMAEVEHFKTKWAQELADGDPYYNRNLHLDSENFEY